METHLKDTQFYRGEGKLKNMLNIKTKWRKMRKTKQQFDKSLTGVGALSENRSTWKLILS